GLWTRLAIGDTDPYIGRPYNGPPPSAQLRTGERVIVDEAGMLDQDTTIALLTIIAEGGATVALVGDRAQLPAIGRGGVLDIAAQAAGVTYDMAEVHRFTDPIYAALTTAMRDRDHPGQVFDQLAALGLIRLHASDDEQREHIAAIARDGETVTVATNEEAAVLNQAIRARRVAVGEVDDTATETGSDGLPIGAGDLIQTRHNDNTLGVANRQTWTVAHVADGAVWVHPAGDSRATASLVRLPAEYVNQWAHLSYAATAYGIQGVTAPASHTILTEALDAAGVYVGMTRGRQTNLLHIIAPSMADARQQYIDAMHRDRADRGLGAATRAAVEAVAGLVDDGTARLVATEKAHLREQAARARQQADRWQHWADEQRRQADQHHAEWDTAKQVVENAKTALAQAHEQVAEPLRAEATADAGRLITSRDAAAQAREHAANAGRFTRRAAQADAAHAEQSAASVKADLTARWASVPGPWADPDAWAARAAKQRAEATPKVIIATQAVQTAESGLSSLLHHQQTEREQLMRRMYGPHGTARANRTPSQRADHYRQLGGQAAAELARLEALPIADAATRIKAAQRFAEQAKVDLRTPPEPPSSNQQSAKPPLWL
ncbi:MAG: AAA family ATPase, partial [Propionibacteriaceae bacterium]|nr:AAA family ATPase [Propionibacteriaceae bacterium]